MRGTVGRSEGRRDTVGDVVLVGEFVGETEGWSESDWEGLVVGRRLAVGAVDPVKVGNALGRVVTVGEFVVVGPNDGLVVVDGDDEG